MFAKNSLVSFADELFDNMRQFIILLILLTDLRSEAVHLHLEYFNLSLEGYSLFSSRILRLQVGAKEM